MKILQKQNYFHLKVNIKNNKKFKFIYTMHTDLVQNI